MEHITWNMGEIIRELRKSRGLTQEALSQAAGVSIQAVSKWETGQSLPDVTLLPSIADFFGVATDTLFGREAPRPAAAKEEAPAALFEDDGKLRVVQFLGSRLMRAEECADGREIRLLTDEARSNMKKMEMGGTLEIEIQGSARINGTINGPVKAAADVFVSGNINGPATAGADITCEGNVNGPATAGASITCKNASGFDGKALNDSLSGLKVSLSGFGSMVSGLFGGKKSGNAHMSAFFSGELPDDDVIRVVQLQGRRLMSAEESSGQKAIRLAADHLTDPLNVEVYGSASITGDVHGNASAGDALTCGNVGGNANAGDSLTCKDVGGSASAGDAMTCGNVGGSVTAGDGVTCGSVMGNVHAGDSVRVSGDVGGNVTASDSVTCGNIGGDVKADSVRCASANISSGKRRTPGAASVQPDSPIDVSGLPMGVLNVVQVLNGRILSAEESRQNHAITLRMDDADGSDIHVHGDAQIEGNIEGDLRANGSVTCETVEGDVAAGGSVTCETIEGDVTTGGSVTCETVEGDVTAGGRITCKTIEGDVNGDLCVTGEGEETSVSCGSVAGTLTVHGASVSCSDVEGNVLAEGLSEHTSLDLGCGSISGNLTVRGASVSCGDVEGSVTAEGTNESSSVSCGAIGGCLTVKGASVECGDIEGDVCAEGENPDATVSCGAVSGNLTVHSLSVTAEDVEGYVYAAGGNPDAEVSCGNIGGSLTAKGITVTCEDVEGSVYTEDRSEDM